MDCGGTMYPLKRVNLLSKKLLKNKGIWGFKMASNLKKFDLPQMMPQMYSYCFLLKEINSTYNLLILFDLVWNNKE